MYCHYLILCIASTSLGAPVDNPVRIDLPVYEEPLSTEGPDNKAVSSARNDDIHNELPNDLTNFVGFHKVSGIDIGGGLLSQPVTTLEGAILETEGLGSQKLTVKENIQKYVASIFQPKPIVDTIREEDKYGNEGDKFYSAGRAIVGGASSLSNLVNAALEVPSNIIKQIARSATGKLNNLGGRLIGLYNK